MGFIASASQCNYSCIHFHECRPYKCESNLYKTQTNEADLPAF